MTNEEFVKALRAMAIEQWSTGHFFGWITVSAALLGARIGSWLREGRWY